MSDLIVMGFDNEFKADEALIELVKMQKEHLVDLEDAAVVVKNAEGKVKIKQAHNLTAAGAMSGSFWGMLIGVIFMNPLIGAVVGAGAGAITGALRDIGIDDDFIKDLGGTIADGTSALFVLVRKATPDRVMAELREFDGHIIRTSLTRDAEEQLRQYLEDDDS